MKNLNKFLAVLGTVALVSCGNGQQEEEEKITIGDNNSSQTTQTAEASTSQASQEGVNEVRLTANDQMQFGQNEIRVQAGQTVKLTLEHVGQLEENVMGHNFVLLKQGTDVTDFGQRAAQARENNYIPEGTDAVIAHTEMIGGGETTTIEFEAPEPGTYTFICSFPGHFVQMQGQFIVE